MADEPYRPDSSPAQPTSRQKSGGRQKGTPNRKTFSAYMEGRKRCAGCEIFKPPEAFTRQRGSFDGLRLRCRACDAVRHAAYTAANQDKEKARKVAYRAAKQDKAKAWETVFPLLESLKARVAALEALLRQTHNAAASGIVPDRPRRKRAVHEHATQTPAAPSASPPIIREIRTIIADDGVKPAEAKRIQDAEIG